MDKFIDKLLETSLGNAIDQSRDRLVLADDVCNANEAKLRVLEERYLSLNLDKADRTLIDEYITCLQKTDHRISDFGYIAGVRDTVKVLHSLDLLQGMEEQE